MPGPGPGSGPSGPGPSGPGHGPGNALVLVRELVGKNLKKKNQNFKSSQNGLAYSGKILVGSVVTFSAYLEFPNSILIKNPKHGRTLLIFPDSPDIPR